MFDNKLQTRDIKSKSSVFDVLVNYVNRDDWKVYEICVITDKPVNSMIRFKISIE